MVPEINLLSFFPGSVLHIENADDISSPATHQAVEELKHNSRHHTQLRK